MFSLTGKVCVVTGASRGIGRAIALAFGEQGADLVLAARSRDNLEEVRRLIEAQGRRAVVHPTDVTDLEQLRALAAAAVTHFGKIDVWVNDAGGLTAAVGSTSAWLDVTSTGWDQMLRLNLTAQVFGVQAAARVMRRQETGGVILFPSSIDSLYAAPGGEGIYGACKAAINNITQTMAVELGQHRIRVNAIAPPSLRRRSLSRGSPRRRIGGPARHSTRCGASASLPTSPPPQSTLPLMKRRGFRGPYFSSRGRGHDQRSISVPHAGESGRLPIGHIETSTRAAPGP